MKKIKENRTEKLQSKVTKGLKEEVLEFAENKDDISESKAVEILVKEALIARGLLK